MKKLLLFLSIVFLLAGCNPLKKATDKAKTYTYKSLKTAVALGIPLKCSYKIQEFEYEGYIKGKQWRGTMQQMGKTTHVILKDNCMYAWSDDSPQGTKICYQEDIWESEDGQFEQPDMEYICTPAVVGDDKFTPPGSVEFMDLNDLESMMQMQSLPSEPMPEDYPSDQPLPEDFPTDEMMRPGLPVGE